MSHGLGYIHVPHNLHTVFPLEAFAPEEGAALPSRAQFTIGPILDQGQTPECVAYTGRDWLSDGPVVNTGGPQPDDLYARCQQADHIQGPHDGTTIHALIFVLTQLGFVKQPVAWTRSAKTISRFMRGPHGQPVVLGIPWTEGMFTPDAHGFIRPTGPIAGGHGISTFAIDEAPAGVKKRPGVFSIENHWSASWGDHGCAYITETDLGKLLRRQAEACSAVEVQE